MSDKTRYTLSADSIIRSDFMTRRNAEALIEGLGRSGSTKLLPTNIGGTGNNSYTDGNLLYFHAASGKIRSSSLPGSGAAGGDLTGTYPNPTIQVGAVNKGKLSATGGTNGQVLGLVDGALGWVNKVDRDLLSYSDPICHIWPAGGSYPSTESPTQIPFYQAAVTGNGSAQFRIKLAADCLVGNAYGQLQLARNIGGAVDTNGRVSGGTFVALATTESIYAPHNSSTAGYLSLDITDTPPAGSVIYLARFVITETGTYDSSVAAFNTVCSTGGSYTSSNNRRLAKLEVLPL